MSNKEKHILFNTDRGGWDSKLFFNTFVFLKTTLWIQQM
jgi:hypothetical protein